MKRTFFKLLDWFVTTFAIIGLSLVMSQPAQAITLPGFPSCTQPQGTVKASYDSGIHGIVGEYGEHRGSDHVYQVADHYLIQCYCPESGTIGIQTNWVTADTFSDNDQDFLIRSGWEYIANGAAWGLQAKPYLAKNSTYACRESGGIGGGAILGTSTEHYPQVLGLADTGAFHDFMFLYSLEATMLIAAYFSWIGFLQNQD